jgi:hypothetical protein
VISAPAEAILNESLHVRWAGLALYSQARCVEVHREVAQYFGFSRPIRQNMNASETVWLTGLRNLYSAKGQTEAALKAIGNGMSASGPALIGASVATDLPATLTSFKVPYDATGSPDIDHF